MEALCSLELHADITGLLLSYFSFKQVISKKVNYSYTTTLQRLKAAGATLYWLFLLSQLDFSSSFVASIQGEVKAIFTFYS